MLARVEVSNVNRFSECSWQLKVFHSREELLQAYRIGILQRKGKCCGGLEFFFQPGVVPRAH